MFIWPSFSTGIRPNETLGLIFDPYFWYPTSVFAENWLYCVGFLELCGYIKFVNLTSCPRTFWGHCNCMHSTCTRPLLQVVDRSLRGQCHSIILPGPSLKSRQPEARSTGRFLSCQQHIYQQRYSEESLCHSMKLQEPPIERPSPVCYI